MKLFKKLMSTTLAVVTALVLAVPAFAAGETYTITINNATDGHTYEAYQVFAGDLSGNVLSHITWGSGVNGEALLTALKADGTIGSYFTDCTTAADVAQVLSDETTAFASNSDNLDAFAAVVGENLATAAGTSTEESSCYGFTCS